MNTHTTSLEQCPVCHQQRSTVEFNHTAFVLNRCAQCGLVFSNKGAIADKLYDNAYAEGGVYDYYLPDAQQAQQQHVPWPMRKFFQMAKVNGTLLDVGCSTGGFILAATKKGWKASGVEPSARAATLAQQKIKAEIWIGSLESIPSNSQYDAITSWEVLEHIAEPTTFAHQIHEHLKPNGVWALSVPNWDSPWMRASKHVEHWPPYHLTFWTEDVLGDFLKKAGFTEVIVQPKPFAWGEELGDAKWRQLPVSLVRSLLLNHKGMHLFAMAKKI